jgi:hypothetical protein
MLSFLMALPLLGWLVQLLVLLAGSGALVLERWDVHNKLHPRVVPRPVEMPA